MKTLLIAATLLFATSTLAQQQGPPPYAPPPHETPMPPATSGEQNPGQMPPDTQAPAARELSTTEIQQQIQQKISDEPGLAGTDLTVNVDDRNVVVQGTVDTEQQHDLALRIAQSYAGDRPITDRVQIRGKA